MVISLIVVINELSRYPEVEVVKGTGAEDDIEACDNIFARRVSCKRLKSENGPLFNGNNIFIYSRIKISGIQN